MGVSVAAAAVFAGSTVENSKEEGDPYGGIRKKATATTKAKCGGFSTAQRTMMPCAAPVEMTHPLIGGQDAAFDWWTGRGF
jgi:hypothetical protein